MRISFVPTSLGPASSGVRFGAFTPRVIEGAKSGADEPAPKPAGFTPKVIDPAAWTGEVLPGFFQRCCGPLLNGNTGLEHVALNIVRNAQAFHQEPRAFVPRAEWQARFRQGETVFNIAVSGTFAPGFYEGLPLDDTVHPVQSQTFATEALRSALDGFMPHEIKLSLQDRETAPAETGVITLWASSHRGAWYRHETAGMPAKDVTVQAAPAWVGEKNLPTKVNAILLAAVTLARQPLKVSFTEDAHRQKGRSGN